MSEHPDDLKNWEATAHAVLREAFSVEDGQLIFLQHSENVTFRVETPQWAAPRLLRLHVPLVPEFGAHGADAAMIASELDWLRALRAETPLLVPLPYANEKGQWVTTLDVPGHGVVNATLISWLPGSHARRNLANQTAVANMGHLIGQLHAFGLRWQRPESFVRPAWDMPRFWQALARLETMSADGRLSPGDVRVLREALSLLDDALTQRRGAALRGLLHGDLYWGNFLWNGDQPALIDFSMCGEGSLLFDLAVCLADIARPCHPVFMQAYREHVTLPDDYLFLLEGFYIASAVFSLSIWANHAPSQEALIARVPAVAQHAADFLANIHFWNPENASE